MIFDITGTVDFSQVQIYNNELINFAVLNRGLKRLYDNDVAIADHLSGLIYDELNTIDARLIAVENLAGDITTMQGDIASLQSITVNYPLWNSTYTTVINNYINWNTAFSLVEANSAAWSAGGGITYLSALLDVAVGGAVSGDVLTWNSVSQKWEPSTAVGGGVSAAVVSGIVENYDAVNGWTNTANEWAQDGASILDVTSYVINTSSDFVTKAIENGYSWNSFWIDNGEGSDLSANLSRSFYNPLATAEYALLSGDIFDTSVGGHNLKQVGAIYVRRSIDNLDADLANEVLTIDGNADGGTINSLYLTMNYKSAMDGIFNMPDAEFQHLMRISGCTFGFTDINESQSYTMFDGFYIKSCTFNGDANQKFFFKNCYVELDTLTISNSCEFHFDNSCTVDAGTFGTDDILTLKNKGIPTYSINGTDPSTISGAFGGFTGPYLYNDTLYQP